MSNFELARSLLSKHGIILIATSSPVRSEALGGPNPVDVDVSEEPMEDGDIVLLCSDGLNTMLSDDQILQTISSNKDDLDKACQELINLANQNGGEDNVTAILVKYNQ
jgi:serine/threonine protein phosphatase PrpC